MLILVETCSMDYAIIAVPAAPVRQKALHQSEMVNQLLFGETVKVLRVKKDFWLKVRSLHDDYEGWLTANLVLPVGEEEARSACEWVSNDLLNILSLDKKTMHVPIGVSLPGFTESAGMLAGLPYHFTGNHLKRNSEPPNADTLFNFTSRWLNAPYMWGGRTPLGVDCSGFVQVNYKMLGFDLPRDAWQQAQEGHAVKKLKEAQAGDLVFFDDRDEIVHVGILLNNEQIIHASGRVRIDPIDKKGIVNADTGKRTHRLEAIRRLW